MNLSRRHFLKTAGAISVGFGGLQTLIGKNAFAAPSVSKMPYGFGELIRDPDQILDLPKGFSYRLFSPAGTKMDDGFFVPTRHDGMAAFPGPNGKTILVRNHEVEGSDPAHGPYGENNQELGRLPAELVYDSGKEAGPSLGGTTTLVYDTRIGRLESHRLSLTGTLRNCAGGPTPWDSWISCEETTLRASETLARNHGYNFEVPATPFGGPAEPKPLEAMGRVRHEAVAVDPRTGIVYQTEDMEDGLIYRFIPTEPGKLVRGGRLQALAVRWSPKLDTRNWDIPARVLVGRPLDVYWVDLDEVDSPKDDLRRQGYERGAAKFARGEGMWYGRPSIFFACTNGGWKKLGQVWRYTPSHFEGTEKEERFPGKLELFIEPNNGDLVERCDNVTVAPWGDLILCEDGEGDEYLVGVTPEGDIYKFARQPEGKSELAGATFSPDGSTLFVNLQEQGFSVAITGPWRSSRAPTSMRSTVSNPGNENERRRQASLRRRRRRNGRRR